MRRLAVISSVLLQQPPKALSPPAGDLRLSGVAPNIRFPIRPSAASLVLSGIAPIITASDNSVLTLGSGSLVLSSDPPTFNIISGLSAIPAAASLVLTGVAPTRSVSIGVTPAVASLLASADAPTISVVTPFTPTNLASLEGWWDASDSGSITNVSGAASLLNDKSGNSNNVAQSTSAARPTITSNINGLGTLTFDNANSQVLTNSTLSGVASLNSGLNVAMMIKPASASTQTFLNITDGSDNASDSTLILYSASGSDIRNDWAVTAEAIASVTLTGAHVVVSTTVGSTLALNIYWDGTAGTPASIGGTFNTPCAHLAIGGRMFAGTYMTGDIGEVIIWAGTSVGERQSVEGYLAWKWGTVSLLPIGHPYKSVAP